MNEHLNTTADWRCRSCGWQEDHLSIGTAMMQHHEWNFKAGFYCPGHVERKGLLTLADMQITIDSEARARLLAGGLPKKPAHRQSAGWNVLAVVLGLILISIIWQLAGSQAITALFWISIVIAHIVLLAAIFVRMGKRK